MNEFSITPINDEDLERKCNIARKCINIPAPVTGGELLAIKARLDESEKQIEAIRRFLSGEKFDVSSNIAEQVSYGYGYLDINGFWEYQLPEALIKLSRRAKLNNLNEQETQDFITMSRQLFSFWQNYPPKRLPEPDDYKGYEELLERLEAALDDMKDGRFE